jgi:hypothetical protein
MGLSPSAAPWTQELGQSLPLSLCAFVPLPLCPSKDDSETPGVPSAGDNRRRVAIAAVDLRAASDAPMQHLDTCCFFRAWRAVASARNERTNGAAQNRNSYFL